MLKFTVVLAAIVVVLVAVLASASATGTVKKVPHLHSQAKAKANAGDGQAVWSQVCGYFGSTTAAAGVMGNIAVESAYTYNYQIHQEGGGNGYGLFQFDFLKSYYFNWLSQTGRSDSSDSQIRFVYDTIYGNQQNLIGSGRAAEVAAGLGSGSTTQAATTFCNDWEQPGIPHLNSRIEAAQQWAQQGC